MKELTDLITPNERKNAKRVGKAYAKVAKHIAFYFFLGIILTAATVITAEPATFSVSLETGQSTELTQFYGETGEDFQLMFFIEQMSGENYVYQFEDGETTVAFPFNENSNDWENWEDWDKNHRSNNVNDLGDIYNYMQQMEWYVQADLLFSESFRFARRY